jgi:hypothetical protein
MYILKGSNFIPIHILNNIIERKKNYGLAFQDMNKAFDRVEMHLSKQQARLTHIRIVIAHGL